MFVVGVFVIFVYLHPVLVLVSYSRMLISMSLLLCYNAKVRPSYRRARGRVGQLAAKLNDHLGGMRDIHNFAAQDECFAAIDRLSDSVMQENIEAVKQRALFLPLIRVSASLNNSIILAGGVYLFLRGDITIGTIIAYLPPPHSLRAFVLSVSLRIPWCTFETAKR